MLKICLASVTAAADGAAEPPPELVLEDAAEELGPGAGRSFEQPPAAATTRGRITDRSARFFMSVVLSATVC
jgi:hypothetical protein